jgi:hypothetical protein
LDIWSVGCIVAEMVRSKVLIEGHCDIDQLHLIFKMFGTPSEDVWPGVTTYPYWRDNFPKWVVNKPWSAIGLELPPDGQDLLQVHNKL